MAYEIYRRGYRVLLIDNDKQGNLSKAYSRYDAESVAPVTRLLAGDWAGSNRADTEYKLRRAAVLHRYCYVEYVTFWGYVEFDKRGQREPDRTL